jgi:3-oxoacyl-[acyl-carrier protein] reductase
MAKWNFTNQVVLITGGTGGIGSELAKAFLQNGGRVYLNVKQRAKAESFLKELRQLGLAAACIVHEFDLRDIPALQQWIVDIIYREHRVDVLINAAAVCPLADVFDVTEELWDDVMDISLKAAFFAIQAVLKTMQQQGSGRIVNIGSTGAYNGGIITTPAYGASKAGLQTMTKWFASKFSQFGICVNAVVPGPTRTKMIAAFPEEMLSKIIDITPDKRLGEVADVVQAAMFLADTETTHITGVMLDVCGGLYLR